MVSVFHFEIVTRKAAAFGLLGRLKDIIEVQIYSPLFTPTAVPDSALLRLSRARVRGAQARACSCHARALACASTRASAPELKAYRAVRSPCVPALGFLEPVLICIHVFSTPYSYLGVVYFYLFALFCLGCVVGSDEGIGGGGGTYP